MYNVDEIVQQIKACAKQQGITQTFLCAQIGKRATYLNEVRLGKDRIRDSEIEAIAAILRTTPEYLKGETDDPSPADSGSEEWMDEIKISPHKLAAAKTIAAMSDEGAAIINGMSKLSVEDLLKVEKIIDMIKQERT